MKNSGSTAYYHVCTDGNALEWMFKDTEDFVAGVNRIGICAIGTLVQVIAFVLMDNHVHFVLYGTMPQCKNFINKYKLLTGKWIGAKYGARDHLRHLPSQLILIESSDQLLDTVAYLDRNPVVAGYRLIPSEYPWGSARYMFKDSSVRNARRISDMNKAEIRKVLKTWVTLPQDWAIDSTGMLFPQASFLDVEFVERLFKTPISYLYHLSKKLEGRIEMQQGMRSFIPDKELRPIAETLASQLFGTAQIKNLDFNARIRLARKLRYDYASTPKQISRMVFLDPEVLSEFI